MAAPVLHPDLMPSLRQLVRGLELLFWSLPFALVVCMVEITALPWASFGVLPLILSVALLWFGVSRIKKFQPQENIWQGSVKVIELLALVMVGLAPFLHWLNQIPGLPAVHMSAGQKHIVYSTAIFVAVSIMFLIHLNHVLSRLAAMLPDPILRGDIRLFSTINFVLFIPLLATLWGSQLSDLIFGWLRNSAPGLANSLGNSLVIHEFLELAALCVASLIIAITMAMIWKAKETVLDGVFSLDPPLEEGEIEIPLDDEPAGEKEKPLDPSLN